MYLHQEWRFDRHGKFKSITQIETDLGTFIHVRANQYTSQSLNPGFFSLLGFLELIPSYIVTTYFTCIQPKKGAKYL